MTSATVLLVDDEPDHAAWVRTVLAAEGFAVVHAATGADGLREVFSRSFAVVIVDGALPDIDGVEWIRRLRAVDRSTPVVFASAFWRDQATTTLLRGELGVAALATKPLVRETFVAQLRRVAAMPPRSAQPPPAPLSVPSALLALKEGYLQRLPAKVAELSRAATLVFGASAGSKELAATTLGAITHAHTLRGTAGTYGLSGVAQAAQSIETTLLSLERGAIDPKAARTKLDVALAAMQQAVEHAAPSGDVVQRLDSVGFSVLLVVSNDADFVQRLAEVGRRNLVHVSLAQGLAQVPTASSSRPLDALIIDAEPGREGRDPLEFARAVRSMPGYEALPFAVVSTDGEVARRIAALHAGASNFISREADEILLAEAIQGLVAIRRAERARIVVVDDDPDFVALMRTALEAERYVVDSYADANALLAELQLRVPDLLLLDVAMHGISGLEACRLIRNDARWRRLPVLLVTAANDTAARQAAFHAGADDYIGKPVVMEELLARAHNLIQRTRLLAERADTDPLTGLLTRRAFLDAATGRVSEAARYRRGLTFAILDIDDFKKVNDTLGHHAGDRVLAGMGRLFRSRLRREDLRGRWGGEEIVLALPYTTPAVAAEVVDKLRSDVLTLLPGEDGSVPAVTFSAGLAGYPEDGETIAALLETADRRLYAAKARGKARSVHEG